MPLCLVVGAFYMLVLSGWHLDNKTKQQLNTTQQLNELNYTATQQLYCKYSVKL